MRVGIGGLLVIIAVGVLVIGGFLWWLNGNPEKLFNEGGENYGSSLARSIGEGGNARCLPRSEIAWLCEVEQDPGSGYSGIFYRLYETGSRCWRAKRLAPGHRGGGSQAGDASLTGCLDLRDFILPRTVDTPPAVGTGLIHGEG